MYYIVSDYNEEDSKLNNYELLKYFSNYTIVGSGHRRENNYNKEFREDIRLLDDRKKKIDAIFYRRQTNYK